MPLTTMPQVVTALPGQIHHIYKGGASPRAAGAWHSLWRVTGFPVAGAIPPTGDGEIPTNATTGAIPFVNPPSGERLYIGRLGLAGGTRAMLIIYDRLWHNSGFDANVNTLQSIATPPTLTRPDSTGHDVELWGEVYTATGATASTFTVTYTNSAGVSGRSATYAKPAAAQAVGEMFPFSLESGDTGVRTVHSVQLSTGTGAVGNFGLVLLRRLFELPVNPEHTLLVRDTIAVGMPRVLDNACLAIMFQSTSTTFGGLFGLVYLIEG